MQAQVKPAAVQIPPHLSKDRYWCGTLHLFMQHSLLHRYFTPKYFDFEEETIDSAALKRLSRPWSQSEKFMLNLALHLFNENLAKVNLSDMDFLDGTNKQLVIEALQLRFN
ncbi:hypothetical protein PSTEL_13145 [Paenibacillus stellifer]|uniref:Uncharacterized protein n=1 Tax=Paenibacillus stellifer TaxID=169760 RepID=A0A089LXF6_9BACL|nr:hypothetical protein [Paenibacillus stellifer]AIQ63888.1 hypothetical protein PSTEL_13145 [Paenibacillus stellifer]